VDNNKRRLQTEKDKYERALDVILKNPGRGYY
jgi:hypothetical protein